jgi:hypothetical protein
MTTPLDGGGRRRVRRRGVEGRGRKGVSWAIDLGLFCFCFFNWQFFITYVRLLQQWHITTTPGPHDDDITRQRRCSPHGLRHLARLCKNYTLQSPLRGKEIMNRLGIEPRTTDLRYGALTTKLPVLTGLQSYLPCWLFTKVRISPCIFQQIIVAGIILSIICKNSQNKMNFYGNDLSDIRIPDNKLCIIKY